MKNLLHILNKVLHPSIEMLEQIKSKAHWSRILLLFVVCFLFTMCGGVYYDTFVLFKNRSLTLHDFGGIITYNIPWAISTLLILCVAWIIQYLVLRLSHGRGNFLTHGWADAVCFTPCVIALACVWSWPVNLWTMVPYLLILAGMLYMCVVNIWMMIIIHEVKWKAAFISTLISIVTMPATFMLIVMVYFMSGIIEFPHPA